MYTQLYTDWYQANRTEPSQDEFDRFQNATMNDWLLAHGWLVTSHSERYVRFWKGNVECQVPHCTALPVRFYYH